MNPDVPDSEVAAIARQDAKSDGGEKAELRQLSRLERLKKKLKKLQGKDPDIYPMW